jgi:hypothetical protein
MCSASLLACTKPSHDFKPTIVDIAEVAKEVKVPKNLMNEIETDFTKETKVITPVYVFVPAELQFSEETKGAIKSPRMIFKFPKGGGRLDLKDVVTGQGSFYMNFFKPVDSNVEFVHLYYLSNSPQKKIDGETFGLGCGRWIDLKKSIGKLVDPHYLKLNVSDLRYLHVVTGTYLLVYRQTTQIFISQITLTDSRYENELCSGAG